MIVSRQGEGVKQHWTRPGRRHTDGAVRAPIPAPLSALLLILAVLGALWPRTAVTALSSYDQRFYLGIAYDLRHWGQFTDGFSYAGGDATTKHPPGMRFTPLYPAFLAAVAQFDPHLRQGIACVARTAGRDPTCPRAAPVARFAQFLMLAGFYWLLWAAIRRFGGSRRAGWIGLGLALLTAPLLLGSVNTLMTETVSLLLSAAACLFAAHASARTQNHRHLPWWLATGLVLGLAILSRPAFLYLLWGSLACGCVIALRQRAPSIAAATATLAAGAALVVGPWMLRNALVLHRASLSFGYASHTLIQRIAFDAMTPREYARSFVCWLPDGSGLGKLIAGPHACDRFGWDEHPDSFYSIGTGPLLQQSLQASGGLAHHMHYILHQYLFANPPWNLLWHLLVTIPLALRGLCVDHYWGLVLAPVSLLAIHRAARFSDPSRDAALLLLSVPAWFGLLFNALVAVNQPRYNLLLILPFSLAGAMLIDRLLRRRNPVA